MVDDSVHHAETTEDGQQDLKRLNFLEDSVRSGAPVVGEYYTYVKGKMGSLQPRIEKTEDMVKRYSEPWVKRYCKRETLVKIDGTVDNAILWAFAYWSAFRKFPGQVKDRVGQNVNAAMQIPAIEKARQKYFSQVIVLLKAISDYAGPKVRDVQSLIAKLKSSGYSSLDSAYTSMNERVQRVVQQFTTHPVVCKIIRKYTPTINAAAKEFNQLVESYKIPLPRIPLIDEAINGESVRSPVLDSIPHEPEEVTES